MDLLVVYILLISQTYLSPLFPILRISELISKLAYLEPSSKQGTLACRDLLAQSTFPSLCQLLLYSLRLLYSVAFIIAWCAFLLGLKPELFKEKPSSNIGVRVWAIACCIKRSTTVGISKFSLPPSGFGISTRFTAWGICRPANKSSSIARRAS